jgi:hypothetical protein
MDEYYPTVILMVLVWFAGLILAAASGSQAASERLPKREPRAI